MSRTSYAVAAVACVVVLAGCGALVGGGGTATDAGDGRNGPATSGVDGSTDERSGTGGGDGTADTDAGGGDGTTGGAGTDADSGNATVDASGPALSSVSFPPGAGAEGITNLTALLAAHRSALADTGYVKRVESIQRADEQGIYERYVVRQRSDVGDGESWHRLVRNETRGDGWTNVSRTEYAADMTYRHNASGVFVVNTYGGDFEERHTRLTAPEQDLLPRLTLDAVGTVERDGHVYVRYRPTNVSYSTDVTPTAVSGELLVREDGLIERFSMSIEFERGGRVSYTREFRRLGSVDVERPAWVNETA